MVSTRAVLSHKGILLTAQKGSSNVITPQTRSAFHAPFSATNAGILSRQELGEWDEENSRLL
jgi:hypothetical protein